ncbi:hypothetical protein OESDEN_00238 [Oesophagostomum dentatum]|uniref:Uncharacterized protein n=1 Tax=Oesophagostomum dentatum TaxID=61180 RepID=A0A0B1TV88_OESDE|nr:hypothetical protein OESDEN_00238 [Oesophagostomum dentatum]
MPTSSLVAGISIVLALCSAVTAFRLREYRRPICAEEQTCSYEALGVVFALCDCPGNDKSCPENIENAVEHRGTWYHVSFLQPLFAVPRGSRKI